MTSVSASASASTAANDTTGFGLTDEDFKSWLTGEIEHVPGRTTYSNVYQGAIQAMVNWRKRYRGNPVLWKRIFKKDRVVKELIESAPILDAVQKLIETSSDDDGANPIKYTIMDLCCGKGYLSMFLSEMLPRERMEKFLLIDKAWPMCNATETEIKPHHMNWDHIYGTIPENVRNEKSNNGIRDTDETYFTTWPIPLHTSKQNLKASSNPRQIKKFLFEANEESSNNNNGSNNGSNNVILLAVHLCGTLSLKAINIFNDHSTIKFFVLKPCCLPPMVHAHRDEIFQIGSHEFDSKEVCSHGKFRKSNWKGPPRWHLEPKYHAWAQHLFRGIDVGGDFANHTPNEEKEKKNITASSRTICLADEDGTKEKREITIQVEGGFQNTYIFTERSPITPKLWNSQA